MSNIFNSLLSKVKDKSYNNKIKKYKNIVKLIHTFSHENKLQTLDNDELKLKINEYLKLDNNEKTIIKTFAFISEASKRLLKIYPYDVQLIGAMVLNDNKIAEMKTGEGKTLVAAIAAIHKAITGNKVFIVTVNDYLAHRDYLFLNDLYSFFDLTCAFNKTANFDFNFDIKKTIFRANIVYTSHNELCFDYLRSYAVNFKEDEYFDDKDMDFVIVDEVDSVLIDDARNPLILSAKSDLSLDNYYWANDLVVNYLNRSIYDKEIYLNQYENIKKMQSLSQEEFIEFSNKMNKNNEEFGDFFVDEANKTINIFDETYEKIENYLFNHEIIKSKNEVYLNGLYLSLINNAIYANYIYKKDRDYIVRDGKVIIIDQSTGRLLETSRWRDGIHQAIECKENVEIISENKVKSEITYQNFFNIFKNKSGMTGTALTEAHELFQVYNLETIPIPTNKPTIRIDYNDKMFLSKEAKYKKLIELILEKHKRGQPILIGTPALYISEEVAKLLDEKNIKYNILNAKNHEKEAEIIANAGKMYSITISTNMAGRGTDIILGGKEASFEEKQKVIDVGGLSVIGVDKNTSRRIDNQLRGRSGRQGEIGDSVFFVSFDDELIVNYTNIEVINYAKNFFNKFENIKNDEMHGGFSKNSWTKNIEQAQRKVELNNYNLRQNTFRFDNIISQQRNAYYKERKNILHSEKIDIEEININFFKDYISHLYYEKINKYEEDNDTKNLNNDFEFNYDILKYILYQYNDYTEEELKEEALQLINLKIDDLSKKDNLESAIDFCASILNDIYNLRWRDIEILEGEDAKSSFKRLTFLHTLDDLWSKHLEEIQIIKQNTKLSVYAQKNPFNEFRERTHLNFMKIFDVLGVQSVINLISENLNREILTLDNIKISDDIKNMSEEELKKEFEYITKKLMEAEILKNKKLLNG